MELKFKLRRSSIKEVEKRAISAVTKLKPIKAMKAAALETIVPEAKRLCPVDSGALRDSIEAYSNYKESTRTHFKVTIRHNKLVRRWWAGELRIPTRYSFYVEKGRGAHRGKNKSYMRPSLDSHKYLFVKSLANHLRIQFITR